MRWTKNYTFALLYVIGFPGAAIIGWFGNSFFAYEEFNSIWASILYLVFISLLFVAALVQDMIAAQSVTDRIIIVAVFGGGLAIFLLLYILGKAVNLCKVEFVDDTYMLWSLIPTAVVSCILIPIGYVFCAKYGANIIRQNPKT